MTIKDIAWKLDREIWSHVPNPLPPEDDRAWTQSKAREESIKLIDEFLKSKISVSNRLRAEDAASAISEANELREKIKEQELIIYGIEEGAEQWKSLCADKDREIQILTEQLQFMTGKYNGAKELLKQYNQNEVS